MPQPPVIGSLALAVMTVYAAAQELQTITWGAVVFTHYGEKTPLLSRTSFSQNITPLGAQQLYTAGSAIRQRYISPSDNGSTAVESPMLINGISTNVIDNSQLTILSMDDEYLVQSAQAFMQGLYPPRDAVWIDEESLLGNGSLVQFPFGGYQYPSLATLSSLDLNSIWIAGNVDCNKYLTSQVAELSTEANNPQAQSTQAFYNSLVNSVFWDFDPLIVTYRYAWQLYEYALFEYTHNRTIYNNGSTFTSSDLANLHSLASEQQFLVNTPNNAGTIPSIAGQTLAAKVLAQFNHVISSRGSAEKLTLLFGTFEPFLSFFALSKLAVGQSASRFNSLPLHGSVMSFELFSYESSSAAGNGSSSFPVDENLWVRFLFRNGTADNEEMIAYSLFERSTSEFDMTWSDFVAGMGAFSLDDVMDWCDTCESITMFCEAIEGNVAHRDGTSSSTSESGLSPAVCGVIGATVTLGVFILGVLVLALFGFRIEHRERNKKAGSPNLDILKRSGSAAGGGFKGAEKLASDADLRLRGGAGASVTRHERVGSWELGEEPTKQQGVIDKDLETGTEYGRVVSTADYRRRSEDERGEDPFGDPVRPVDQV